MMIHGDLPPVGDRISLQASADNPLEDLFDQHKYWLDSGTSALALALLDAKAKLPQVKRPRAIIPGYCCPDLVAACVYAGVEPVAVDISINDPSYDMEQLRIQLNEQVVAVIAINFLGIAERLKELKELIVELGSHACLIEDNAQWFPASIDEVGFVADYVTFSFGRGKPLSLLGGGLLLARKELAGLVLDVICVPEFAPKLLRLKITAYNILLSPRFYMLLNRNPLMPLGVTRYVPLLKIAQLDIYRRSLLASNFSLYSQRKNNFQHEYDDAVVVNDLQQLKSLRSARAKKLLRYPLLCPDAVTRDKLLAHMTRNGLGATPMYAMEIDQIDGVRELLVVPSVLENATSFARRFITLPISAESAPFFQNRILSSLRDK